MVLRWLLITSTPLLWGFVDMAAARVWANDSVLLLPCQVDLEVQGTW